MLKVGLIGAGAISKNHIESYLANPECEIIAIADLNQALAQSVADKYNIPNVYSDYHDILNNDEIDAISIVTPTFTHKAIALDAIHAHKHILCEKPPALNADEAKEIEKALEGYDKTFMYAFVCRFKKESAYAKQYIENGKLGQPICVEAVRISQLSQSNGWLASRKLGGGALRDEAIHELDLALYLLGYPKPKRVMAFESHLNNELPPKMRSEVDVYQTAGNTQAQVCDTEDIIKAFIEFDNGVNLTLKVGKVVMTQLPGRYVEIIGQKSGLLLATKQGPSVIEVTDDYYLKKSTIELNETDSYKTEVNHFVNCCLHDEKCIVTPSEAVTLMETIDAVYEAAATGKCIEL